MLFYTFTVYTFYILLHINLYIYKTVFRKLKKYNISTFPILCLKPQLKNLWTTDS